MSSAERKAVIKHADMNEEMQQDAIDCANVALEKFNIEKTSPPTSRKNSIRSITPPGIASSAETSAPTSPTRLNTSSTSTWDKWQSFCSNQVETYLNPL